MVCLSRGGENYMRHFYHSYTTELKPRVMTTTSFEEVHATSNLTRYVNFVHSVFLLCLRFYFQQRLKTDA